MKYEVKEVELANGAKGLLVDVKGAKVMRFSLGFMGGTLLCPPDKPEIAHALEHMVLKANEVYREEKDFVMEVCKNGADLNAATGGHDIQYIASCADFEWERVLKLLTLAISKPLLSAEHFKTEMKVISEELTGHLDNYARIIGMEIIKACRGIDLVPEKRVKLLDNLDLEDLKRFYARTHFAANMRFVIVGDLTGKEKALKALLTDWELGEGAGKRFSRVHPPFQSVEAPVVVDNRAAGKMYFELNVSKGDGRPLSFEERVSLSVIHELLIGSGGYSLASRINGQARERGLTYGIGSSWDSLDSELDFGGSVERTNAPALLELVAREVRRVLDGGLSDKELRDIKRRLAGGYSRKELSTARLINHYEEYIIHHEDETYEDYDMYEKMLPAITREQVLDTYRRFFSSGKWCFGLLGADPAAIAGELYGQVGSIFKA